MKQSKLWMSLFVTGGMFCAVMAADAKPAEVAKPADAKPAEAAKPELWAKLPEVVAQIGDQKITKKEVIDSFLKQLPGGQLPQGIPPEMLDQAAPGIVKGYVDQKLMEVALEKSGIKPSEAFALQALNEQVKEFSAAELEGLKQQLAIQGKTLEQQIAENAKNPEFQKQIAFQKLLEDKALKGISVTEADAKAYYDANANQFKTPADKEGTVRASHILIMAQKDKATEAEQKAALEKATKLMETLKKDPSQFEALAKSESQCPSGQNGGSLGAFGKGQMVPEFEKAVFELKEGEMAGPVKTDFGYHIIRRDKAQGEVVEPFDKVKEQLTQFLKAQKEQKAVMDYIAGLEKSSNVKFHVEMPAMN